ncbi:hypothetical protein LSAT2_027094, partial [Lamellibrachia satsuma]
TLFRDASRELAAATGGRVRFGHIDILVPTSWNTTTATSATAQRFGNADFIVAPAKLSHGDAPYTQRVGGCGKRGEFVHITPKYVSDPTYASRWGPRGRTMVHEWAHYWWGVFDEYPTRNKPYYTDPNGQLSPVMCPANFPGDWLTLRGDPCQAGARGCRFISQDPSETGPSFMAFYHLPNVTQFCNESGDHPHNVFAPTKQNKMCNRRSVWSVIQQHADFNPPTNAHTSVRGLASADTSTNFPANTDTSTNFPTGTDTPTSVPECVVSFREFLHKHAKGAYVVENANKLDKCKKLCIENENCTAIDFTTSMKCWIHTKKKYSLFNNSDVNHYMIDRDCPSTINGHPSERPDTNLTFAVVKRRDQVLFVLDGNIKASHQRLMQRAFNEYIERAESGSRVAVVSFGNSATLETVLEWNSTANTPTDNPSSIPDCNDNSTRCDESRDSCIGDALSTSLQKIPVETRAGAVIMLLTPGRQAVTGDENCTKPLDGALNDLETKHVTLHAVFTEDGADSSTIQQAVETTGGRSLRLSSIRDNPESAFLELLAPDKGGTQAKIQVRLIRDVLHMT